MSDEDGGSFGFMFQPPPELVEQIMRQRDQGEMMRESKRHDVVRFLYALPEEDLATLGLLIHAVKHDNDYGSFIEGQLMAIRQLRYNICVACGNDHDKVLFENEDQPVDPAAASNYRADNDLFSDWKPPTTEELLKAEEADMEKYGMRYPHEGEVLADDDEKPVVCINCGSLYQSLQDRMLRAPGLDGCYGCQHKAAHG